MNGGFVMVLKKECGLNRDFEINEKQESRTIDFTRKTVGKIGSEFARFWATGINC